MNRVLIRRAALPALAVLLVVVAAQTPALGERLPVRSYTIDDGLPSDDVRRIVRDSTGYLWLLTARGLCRFDGRVFTTLGPEHGLPEGRPRDLLETSDGVFLVGMIDGLYWYDSRAPAGDPLFSVARPVSSGQGNAINTLHEDRDGRIWCGTQRGLYRLERSPAGWRFDPVDIGRAPDDTLGNAITDVMDDDHGSLWLATAGGIVWRGRDGALASVSSRDGLTPIAAFNRLVQDDEGRVWAGATDGLALLRPDPVSGRPVAIRTFGNEEPLLDSSGVPAWFRDIVLTSEGDLWAAGNGLVHIVPQAGTDSVDFRVYDDAHGLSSPNVMSVAEDLAGNLWVGTSDAGMMRIAHGGFVSFGPDDGLNTGRIAAFSEDEAGRLRVVTAGRPRVATFDGQRFHVIEPDLPREILDIGWGAIQIHFVDHLGEWWFATFGGLFRFPSVRTLDELAQTPPRAHYTTANGLLSDGVFRAFEDSRGDLWIGLMNYAETDRNGLQRWDRGTETFQTYGPDEGVPRDTPTSFHEDSNGDLWVGFYRRGLGRFRDGQFELFDEADGAPPGYVSQFHEDRSGRLWVATGCCGVVRIEGRSDQRPRFIREPWLEGLASRSATCIIEDDHGRFYIGSDLGIDRYDPGTGQITHYTRQDGLLDNWVFHAFRQSDGTLWFGLSQGLARLQPESDRFAQPAPVIIRGLSVGDARRNVSPFGEREISDLELAYVDRQLELEFSAPGFATGEELEFQYRLAGGGGSWSPPSRDRRIHFASLSAGRYRLEVRAVNAEGEAGGPAPATVSFRVLPPFWMSWWFLTGIGLAVVAVAIFVHRLRLQRALGLERVRTRIATDLHDDIGASLSQVSILSEVVRQQVGDAYPSAAGTLSQIADTARQLVESMSDIVWAVNPKHDRAVDLVQRMRRFASDTLSGKDIALRFEAAPDGTGRKLDVDLRRQVFLIFKEAVNNAARHSGCSAAEVRVRVDGRHLKLDVADDGCGFESGSNGQGHGLESMQQRARQLGGSFLIESNLDAGTAIHVTVPLRS